MYLTFDSPQWSPENGIWIGASDTRQEGIFAWSDGSKMDYSSKLSIKVLSPARSLYLPIHILFDGKLEKKSYLPHYIFGLPFFFLRQTWNWQQCQVVTLLRKRTVTKGNGNSLHSLESCVTKQRTTIVAVHSAYYLVRISMKLSAQSQEKKSPQDPKYCFKLHLIQTDTYLRFL